jgi:hypothetical protein
MTIGNKFTKHRVGILMVLFLPLLYFVARSTQLTMAAYKLIALFEDGHAWNLCLEAVTITGLFTFTFGGFFIRAWAGEVGTYGSRLQVRVGRLAHG